jgi:hypothetical protein
MTTQKTVKDKAAEKQEKVNEANAAIKNFKSSSEVEVLYRFIHENNLRNEAKILLTTVLESLSTKRKKKVLQ